MAVNLQDLKEQARVILGITKADWAVRLCRGILAYEPEQTVSECPVCAARKESVRLSVRRHREKVRKSSGR